MTIQRKGGIFDKVEISGKQGFSELNFEKENYVPVENYNFRGEQITEQDTSQFINLEEL